MSHVIISVKGTRSVANQEASIIELITEGTYEKLGNAYYITYQESQVTGLEGTTTTLKIEDGIVTLLRMGTVNSQLIFERGQKHISYYDTNEGNCVIGVLASDVEVQVNEHGGEIRVDYELEIDNNKTGENDFYMMIREVGRTNDQHGREYKAASQVCAF